MSDLVSRLNIKAGVMEMGEKIAWGSDTALMREAAAEITRLQKELDTARESLERLVTTYDGMEDGNGDPCPDVAHAKTVIRALKDEEVAG